jgi:hypothetical protein
MVGLPFARTANEAKLGSDRPAANE